jgi:hypothetical protein
MAHWKKGQSGNPKGRPPGSRNRSTAEIKDLLAELVPFEDLVVKLWNLTKRGNVRAAELLLAYRYGRPTAGLEVEAVDTGDLVERAMQSLAASKAELSDSLVVDRDGVRGKSFESST